MSEPRASEAGFSLLEVLVAIVVLSTVAAGLAGLFALAAMATRSARSQTLATLIAMDKIEQLRGLMWSFDANGAAVSDTTSDLSTRPTASAGQGLRPSPPDSLQRNTIGYVDYLDDAGQWTGTGAQPAPGAVFIRRWNIQPLPADPVNTLIFQVLVRTVAGGAGGAGGRRPGDAMLTSVRTRKAS